MRGHILVVDDEPNIRALLAGVLEDEGMEVSTACDAVQARKQLAARQPDLMLLDVQLPGQDGLGLLRSLQAEGGLCPVVMMSGHGTIATAVEATRLGAIDFIEKPIQVERLLVSLANGLRLRQLTEENARLQSELGRDTGLLGSGAAMEQLRQEIARAAGSEARVLITGENGTGKELIARALHAGSPRADRPFIKVNCAAIPSELLESELFGHERGAFTGAVSRRVGKFERAQGGTLLLDEIGDMNATTQAKLLRVLEDGELERLGGTGVITLDVRIFASTNRDLEALRASGDFREDLYHRVKVVPIHAPALRDHVEDIPELARHFLEHFCRTAGRPTMHFTAEALRRLQTHDWPGNVRELRNLVERVMIMAPGEAVEEPFVESLLPGAAACREPVGLGLADYLLHHEKSYIGKALTCHGGNLAAAARELGLDRANLHRRLKKLGMSD
ncbi:Fis family transcriptional regulator [bacterium DOLZORAL124_64_63]|nr:MAG: Fis family transcriptional regulator [bacterium DOLZORAL124_64_63]